MANNFIESPIYGPSGRVEPQSSGRPLLRGAAEIIPDTDPYWTGKTVDIIGFNVTSDTATKEETTCRIVDLYAYTNFDATDCAIYVLGAQYVNGTFAREAFWQDAVEFVSPFTAGSTTYEHAYKIRLYVPTSWQEAYFVVRVTKEKFADDTDFTLGGLHFRRRGSMKPDELVLSNYDSDITGLSFKTEPTAVTSGELDDGADLTSTTDVTLSTAAPEHTITGKTRFTALSVMSSAYIGSELPENEVPTKGELTTARKGRIVDDCWVLVLPDDSELLLEKLTTVPSYATGADAVWAEGSGTSGYAWALEESQGRYALYKDGTFLAYIVATNGTKVNVEGATFYPYINNEWYNAIRHVTGYVWWNTITQVDILPPSAATAAGKAADAKATGTALALKANASDLPYALVTPTPANGVVTLQGRASNKVVPVVTPRSVWTWSDGGNHGVPVWTPDEEYPDNGTWYINGAPVHVGELSGISAASLGWDEINYAEFVDGDSSDPNAASFTWYLSGTLNKTATVTGITYYDGNGDPVVNESDAYEARMALSIGTGATATLYWYEYDGAWQPGYDLYDSDGMYWGFSVESYAVGNLSSLTSFTVSGWDSLSLTATKTTVYDSTVSTIKYPAATAGKMRDFIVRLDLSAAPSVPNLTWAAPTGETVSYETEDGEFPTMEKAVNLVSFTETDAAHPGKFAVAHKVVKPVSAGGAS